MGIKRVGRIARDVSLSLTAVVGDVIGLVNLWRILRRISTATGRFLYRRLRPVFNPKRKRPVGPPSTPS